MIQRLRPIRPRRHSSQSFHDVGNIDCDAAHVEDQRSAIEEEIRFGGFEEFDEEAEETGADYDVEDARDEGWGGVDEF